MILTINAEWRSKALGYDLALGNWIVGDVIKLNDRIEARINGNTIGHFRWDAWEPGKNALLEALGAKQAVEDTLGKVK